MTIDAAIHDAPPTPRPWEDDEQSVRAGLRALATHVLGRLDEQDRRSDERHRMLAAGLQLELGGVKEAVVSLGRAVDQMTKREEVTGRYLIDVAAMAGEAKGVAQASRHKSTPPALRALSWLGATLAEHWATHLATLAVGAVVAWLLHHVHLLP